MSLKVFLLLLLGLVLLTTSTLAAYDSHRPPRGGPYRKGPPKHGPPHLSEDTLADENLALDDKGYRKRPPYKKKPPVEETEGKSEYGRHDEPEPRPRHEPIREDPGKGYGPKKPPHKPPLEN